MKMKFVLSCFFILLSLLSYSQDLIETKDNFKIFCEITKEDSATIYYKQVKEGVVSNFSIKKAEVLKYYSSKAMVQSQIKKADSIAGAKPKYKDDFISFDPKTKFTYHDKRYGNRA